MIKIDRSRCVGIGRCEALAPRVFEVDDEGYLHLLFADGLPVEDLEDIEAAIRECPMSALSLE
jgi:ferredoxin